MFTLIILFVSSCITAFGFLAMRNPMRFEWLSPRVPEGYYQRMVLDPSHRQQLRVVGMFFSFFGLMILSGALSDLLNSKFLATVNEGMLALLWLVFVGGFGSAAINSIVQVARGRWKEHFFSSIETLRLARELGPIAVDPLVTPRMHKKSRVFTIIYCILATLPFVVALVIR